MTHIQESIWEAGPLIVGQLFCAISCWCSSQLTHVTDVSPPRHRARGRSLGELELSLTLSYYLKILTMCFAYVLDDTTVLGSANRTRAVSSKWRSIWISKQHFQRIHFSLFNRIHEILSSDTMWRIIYVHMSLVNFNINILSYDTKASRGKVSKITDLGLYLAFQTYVQSWKFLSDNL